MANRVLRDWTFSENIEQLSYESEVFFTRLIMKADDYGKFHASEKLLKAALFPLRDIKLDKITKMLQECEQIGVIKVYFVNEKPYLKINDFGQRLRVMNSKFPDPLTNDSNPLTNDSIAPHERKKEVETEEKETEQKETHPTAEALEINFDILLETINKIFGRKFEVITDPVKKKYKALLKHGYSKKNIQAAMLKCKNDNYHIDTGYKYCTLEYFSRPKTMDLYGTVPTELPKQLPSISMREINNPYLD